MLGPVPPVFPRASGNWDGSWAIGIWASTHMRYWHLRQWLCPLIMMPTLCFTRFICLKGRLIGRKGRRVEVSERGMDKETEILYLLVHSLNNCRNFWPGQSQDPGFYLILLCGWQELKYLGHHLLPPRCSRKLRHKVAKTPTGLPMCMSQAVV